MPMLRHLMLAGFAVATLAACASLPDDEQDFAGDPPAEFLTYCAATGHCLPPCMTQAACDQRLATALRLNPSR